MKLPKIAAKEWRLIRLVLVVLVPYLGYTRGIKPYQAHLADVRQQAVAEEELLIRERNAVETAKQNPMLQQTTDSALRALEPRLFEGRDDIIAGSEVASYLGELAYQNQVWLQDAQTRGATQAAEGVRMLHVELRAESDLQGILGFLRALENGDKLVRVEQMSITKAAKGVGGTSANSDVETLALTATIGGYAMGELSTGKAAAARGKAGGGTARPLPQAGGGK